MDVCDLPKRTRILLASGIFGCCGVFFVFGFCIKQVVGTIYFFPLISIVLVGMILSLGALFTALNRMASMISTSASESSHQL